ncbi:hypothetical protein Esti_004479 [Eimeria stiedai]
MVVTRQGTETASAAAPSPAGPRLRSPRRGGAQQRAPSAARKKATSPSPSKGAEARAAASPRGTPRLRPPRGQRGSPPPAKPKRGRTPRVQLASRAEVMSPSGRTSSRRGGAKTRPLLRGGLLAHRPQTGPLPFVREMRGMSDLGEEGSEEPYSATEASAEVGSPTLHKRLSSATAAAAERPGEEPLEQASSSLGRAASDDRAKRSEGDLPSLPSRSTRSSSGSSSRLSEGKLGQLLLTYFCYASLYLARKPFASAKRELELQLGLTTSALGGIDTAFLGTYAASQLLLAPALLGAPKGPSCETILTVAYAVSAGCCFCIYALPEALLSPLALSFIWGLNGAAQALAFPLIVALLSTWFSSQERGGVLGNVHGSSSSSSSSSSSGSSKRRSSMTQGRAQPSSPQQARYCICLAVAAWLCVTSGLWTTCQQVGSIFASYLTAELLTVSPRKLSLGEGLSVLEAPPFASPNWRLAFLVPAIWVMCCAILLARGLRRAASEGSFSSTATEEADAAAPQQQQQQQQQQQGKSSFSRTIGLSSIRRLCAAYFCVKLVRYSLLYWLPYYFEKHVNLTSSAAAYYCIYFDAGGVFGSVAVGWFSDRYLKGRRLLLLAPVCCLGGLCVALLHHTVLLGSGGEIPILAQAALLLAGAAIAAPDSVLGGTATADACGDEPAGQAADLTAMASFVSLMCISLAFSRLFHHLPQTRRWPSSLRGAHHQEIQGSELV